MPELGNCRLCLEERELLESHFISRKFYYSGKMKLEFNNLDATGVDPDELKAHLLCFDCEQRFSRNGEDEVLRHISPKLVLKRFPLADRMKVAWPRDNDPTAPRFAAQDFDIDSNKFAYFALSLIWRRAIHDWGSKDTGYFPRWELGAFAEQMRCFLLGKTPFPSNMAVIVIVCNDALSRKTWTVPAAREVITCLDYCFQARGIYFRVLMGNLPVWSFDSHCLSPLKPIFYGNCERRTTEEWDTLTQARASRRSS
jgi:hypothetical protein